MSKFCTQCGTENISEAKFCKSCGHSLIEKSSLSRPNSEPIQEKIAAVKTENKSFIADYWHWIIGVATVVFVPIIVVPMSNKHTDTPPVPAAEIPAPVDLPAPAAEIPAPAAEIPAPAAVSMTAETPAPVLSEIEQAEQDCNHGNVDACYYLGKIYDTYFDIRDSVKKDNNQAVKFYKKACNGGNANGCVSVGSMYVSGEGVKIDGDQAIKFYKKGCDGGRTDACQTLGTFYDGGRIIGYKVVAEDDKTKAIRFYKKACDGGNANGCNGYEKLLNEGY